MQLNKNTPDFPLPENFDYDSDNFSSARLTN